MKKITTLVIALIMCISLFSFVANAAEFKFTDVPESEWYHGDVKSAVEMGLINGKSETIYAPEDNLTYAEAIKLAACMHQLYMDGVVTLKNGDPWYQTYVDYCFNNNIINTEYDYDAKATRSGYMVIFANALPDEALAKINSVPDNSIPDVPSTRAYAPAVYKLYRAGILQGSDAEHNCKPSDNIKRSEVAAILSRMMDETKRVKFSMGEEEEETTEEEKTEEKDETEEEVNPEDKNESEEEVKPEDKDESEEEAKPEDKDESEEEAKPGDKDESEEEEPEEEDAIAIKTQPANAEVTAGNKIDISVEATGGAGGYIYQWQLKNGAAWSTFNEGLHGAAGIKTQTLSLTPTEAGTIEVRCIVSDKDGNPVVSDAAVITVKAATTGGGIKDKYEQGENEELKNEDFAMTIDGVYNIENRGIVLTGYVSAGKVNVGDTVYLNDADGKYVATTTVKAIEMFRKLIDESKKGDKPGINVDLDVETYKAMDLNGYVLSATKGSSSLGTRPSTGRPSTEVSRPLPVETNPLTITSQPKDSSGSVGIFRLDVEVEGGKAPYTYQWQRYVTITIGNRKTSKYANMVDSEGTVRGATTANLMISVTELGTYKYKCVITDADGNSVTTDEAVITVNSESTGGRVSIPSSGKTDY